MDNSLAHLKDLIYKGAKDKGLSITDVVLDRINEELSVIKQTGSATYFILYARIVAVCNELNLLRTPGRGSAAGSLVNYCLDITKVNPIAEELIFERFLNPKLKQRPDIDIDIPVGSRKKVMSRLKQKHPEYHTYFIAFLPNRATHLESIPYNDCIYKKHPCGIVITEKKLTHSVFWYKEEAYYLTKDIRNDEVVKKKVDLVELSYLNRLQLIIDEIGKDHHPYKLPLDDPRTFELLSSGNLDNIFQFNYSTAEWILTDFRPESISDLSIINAMLRPRLWRYIEKITAHKFNDEERKNESDLYATKALKETYGFPVFQETFLHLFREFAGLNFAEADLWRRKITQNGKSEDITELSKIIAGNCAGKSGLSEGGITELNYFIKEFLPVSYLQANSICYSTVAYWSAFYKTHFRSQFNKAFEVDLKPKLEEQKWHSSYW